MLAVAIKSHAILGGLHHHYSEVKFRCTQDRLHSTSDPFPRAISSQLLSLGPCPLDQNARDRPKSIEFRGQIADTQ
jgi:hypothetical protein